MTNKTVKLKEFKEWLDENYPLLSDPVSFGDLDEETTKYEFEYFKNSMRQFAKLPVKIVSNQKYNKIKKRARRNFNDK